MPPFHLPGYPGGHHSDGPRMRFPRHDGIYRSDVVKTKSIKPEGGRRLPLVGPEPQSKDATGGNNRVLLFSKEGKLLKQIGKGAGGPQDKGKGPGEWDLPHKLAVDAQENLYIIDREGKRVQVFDKNLTYMREFASPGWNPWDIGISRKGTEGIAFIADHADERVHKIQLSDGKILATWGRQGLGPGEFDWVHGVVVDSLGAVYAADTYGQRLQKFVPTK